MIQSSEMATSIKGKVETGAGKGLGDKNKNPHENGLSQEENCLICNNPYDNKRKADKPSTSRASRFIQNGDFHDIREVIYRAFDIQVDESYFQEIESDLPICSACTLKCGQLKEVGIQLEIVQREYDRLREDIAFSIVDIVASGSFKYPDGISLDKNQPKSIFKKVRHCEVELIQQLIFESWHDRFPTEVDGEDPNFDESQADEMQMQTQELSDTASLKAMVEKSQKSASKNTYHTSSKSSSNTTVGKTTIISITTPDEDTPAPTSSRRRTSDSDDSGSTIENDVEIDLNNRQITITNGKGVVLNNSNLGLINDTNSMFHTLSPGRMFPNDDISSSPDYLMDDSDFDEDALEAEYDDMEQLVTPQLNLSAELFGRADNILEPKQKAMNLPHDLEVTKWSGSDESQHRAMIDFENEEDDEDHIDDFTLDDFDEDMPGRRERRSLSSSSSDQYGPNGSELEFHQNEEGLYVCMFCSKTFIHKYPYRDHLKTHTGEGPRCPVCNKIFPKNHNLMLHMRTHTGEKPYKCEVCRKGFADKSNLKVHMRVHTGERPYKCEYCDQAFVNSSRLVVHRRLHTGEKPFPCDMCARSFSTSNQLQSHRKIHFTGKPFTCESCGKGYTNLTSLTAHMNHFHSGGNSA